MYKLNSTLAKKAEAGGYIDQSGKYVGVFTRAENVKSQGGARGIQFDFRTEDGAQANNITIWTISKTGEYIRGMYMINALMTCLKVKEMAPRTDWIEKWNWEIEAKEKLQAEVFHDLMNKPVGVVIQMEEYEKMKGGIGQRPQIVRFFESGTGMTATEILDKKAVPQELDKFMKRLEANPVKRLKKKSDTGYSAQMGADQQPPQIEDDDIPF